MDISKTIEADSTQVNADDLAIPRTVTITGVSKGTIDQPVNLDLAEFPGRAYRPNKSMRRVIVAAWGPEASDYVGRRLEIYNDPTVRWAGQPVGGIKISKLSHIDKPLSVNLTVTRGKRQPHKVEPLPDDAPPTAPTGNDLTAAKQRVWQAHKATQPDLSDTDRKVEVAQLIARQGLDPNSAADMDKLVGVISGD